MTESRPDTDAGKGSHVEPAVTGEGERRGDASRPGVVAVVATGGAMADEDGLAAGSDPSSPGGHDPTPELNCAGDVAPLVTSSDFTSGSSTFSSSLSRHCFPSSSICFTNKQRKLHSL